jgi:GAF domain-containing protein
MGKLGINELIADLEQFESQGAEWNNVLRRAVTLLHEACPVCDWTGIYELHPDGALRLGPYVGEPTEHVLISVGQGVCGSAVANNCNMNIPDVTKASNYLACSAATKSELVVLIRRNGRIYAQIDIDSHQFDAFSEEIAEQVEQLADWLAAAYERRIDECAGVPAHASS